MEGFLSIQCRIKAFLVSKVVQGLVFLTIAVACNQDKQELNYPGEKLIDFITDLTLLDASLQYYPRHQRDSVQETLTSNLLLIHQVDSNLVFQDIERISRTPELAQEYFEQVKNSLDSLRK